MFIDDGDDDDEQEEEEEDDDDDRRIPLLPIHKRSYKGGRDQHTAANLVNKF